jgi:drug/metabolite transporter (DMT)-like permease
MGHIGGKVFGDLLALLGMLSVTVYFLIGRILRKRLATFPYVTAVYGTSAFFLIIFAMVNGDALTGYAPEEYLIFLLLALIPSGIGHTSYNYALKYLKAYVVSISVLGEPLLASLLAMPIFGEVPSFTTALGGLMIGSGMYITLKYEKRNDLKS